MTTVVSVRGRKREELLADPNFVYVGRAVPRCGWQKSEFCNPFSLASYPKTAVVLFERCVLSALSGGAYPLAVADLSWRFQPKHFWDVIPKRLPELRGKTLGCWCCDWDGTGEPEIACHAVVLAKLADAMEDP